MSCGMESFDLFFDEASRLNMKTTSGNCGFLKRIISADDVVSDAFHLSPTGNGKF